MAGRVFLLFKKGWEAWQAGEFSSFCAEWLAFPLVVLCVAAAIFLIAERRRAKNDSDSE